jgi:acyl-CoA thioesterase-1
MMRFVIRLLCVLPLLGATHAVGQTPVILVFGDSLSAGYGLPQGRSWVHLLQRRLQSNGLAYRVVNASVSGETTLGGRNRLARTLAEHKPQIVILELGANDALRGQPIAGMRDNLEHMIEASRDINAKVVLVGMQIPPNYGSAYTKKFQDAYREVAQQTGVAFVPFLLEGFAERRELFQADGVHPTIEAQQKMLDNVWAKLEPMLAKSRKS